MAQTLAFTAAPAAVQAQSLLASTYLLDVRQGSTRSEAVRRASRGGYELADGTRVSFSDWYGTDWPDLHVDFLTVVNDNLGLIWGFSTGEHGEKYRISPGVKLGFLFHVQPTPRSALSVTVTVQLGSVLSERDCTADYGEIGGVQRVNCRLAASTLPPAETMKYNMSMNGIDDSRIALNYTIRF